MSATDIPPPQSPGSGVASTYRTGRTVMALMLREMSTRYGRSPGGYIWAILEPLGGVFILAIGFSLLLRNPPLGNNFILFYATGFVPFILYQNVSTMVARALKFSRPLLRYPVVSWMDAIIARFVLNALTGILVGHIVIFIVLMLTDSRAMLDVMPILTVIGLVLLLSLGVGMLNCALSGLIDAWDMIWSVATRPLFIASGVLFLYEDMPRGAQDILWYNPLFHIVGLARTGFYATYEAAYVSELYVVGFSLIALFMGIVLLYRYHRDILTR
ncbi:ABC transporter permease [Lutimaribacter sp. EGI FJ00015]|uniref:ABC transporter permease n=1 Tax=Lutimaribacter degradans TaxID=2945989 RepID=A0ACC6A0N5_9RHOB|nr:ABC transporter permease [Lutimaribacter sp. EGI FJ00013]MCM2563862.1 ABC transporter permease [Lutimaribacter sp. EGI FJ00013]MCO0615039.1 ABC transporter permease [Lutimaribacter sp. EGI FJ00015]MCO0637711.1 ABC transporter permease [Lutimaribacter sp. EGI FJ00014]